MIGCENTQANAEGCFNIFGISSARVRQGLNPRRHSSKAAATSDFTVMVLAKSNYRHTSGEVAFFNESLSFPSYRGCEKMWIHDQSPYHSDIADANSGCNLIKVKTGIHVSLEIIEPNYFWNY